MGRVGGGPIGWFVWFNLGFQDKPFWQGFFLLGGIGLALMVIVTYLTPPEDNKRLVSFYSRCLPFGFWGPIARQVTLTPEAAKLRDYGRDFGDVAIAITCTATMVIGVNALAGLWLKAALACSIICLGAGYWLLKRWQARGFMQALRQEEIILENAIADGE